jgi:D-alanyl-D-alanine carboxypeptidase/D-alanyl-D-alanine-endopeptidase (penicillin-binding protein 4)
MSVPSRRIAGSSLAVVALAVSSVLVAGSAHSTPHVAASPQDTLSSQLETILSDPHESGAQYALTVRDVDTGTTLFDENGSTRLLPASNAKLYTSTAALDVLGPDYRFHTAVLRTGAVHGSVLRGDLYLKGYGDPMATAADYKALARKVAASGVRTVRGNLIADDTYFDDVRLAPFWSWDDEPYYYSAQTSALNISPDDIGDTGTVLIDVSPAKAEGKKPVVTMIPKNKYVRIKNTATTGASGSAQTIDATRPHGKNVVDITGSIPLGASAYASQPSVDQPTRLVADVFRRALARVGVRVTARTRYAAAPSTATDVVDRSSEPLSQILVPWLKLSNNMIAEAVTKALGAAASGTGTWSAGTDAILQAVAADGVDTATLQLFDGSGLGRADYVTSDQTVKLLESVRAKSWFGTWYDSLPIAGNPDQLVGGTLRHRMAGTAAANNLHGKTGSMTGVSALSGYVTDKAGDHLVFSMMSNNFVEGGITPLEDQVGVTLANYDG